MMSLANPTLEDVWKLFQETDRKIKENNDNLSQEITHINRELTQKIEKVSTDLDRLGNKLGDFIEEMLYLAAVRLFKKT
jgi:hypothetical protein